MLYFILQKEDVWITLSRPCSQDIFFWLARAHLDPCSFYVSDLLVITLTFFRQVTDFV